MNRKPDHYDAYGDPVYYTGRQPTPDDGRSRSDAELLRSLDDAIADKDRCDGFIDMVGTVVMTEAAARLRELLDELTEMKRERAVRNAIDPVTRMHNLCDHLAEHRRESPYNAESLELADASNRELQQKLKLAMKVIEAAKYARLRNSADSPGDRWTSYEAWMHVLPALSDFDRKEQT